MSYLFIFHATVLFMGCFLREIILFTWQFREYVSTADEFASSAFLSRKKTKPKWLKVDF